MKKTILTLAVAAAGTMISGAASADFCGNYASSMVNINTEHNGLCKSVISFQKFCNFLSY